LQRHGTDLEPEPKPFVVDPPVFAETVAPALPDASTIGLFDDNTEPLVGRRLLLAA
jgi:hypothetical protein